MKSYMFFLVVSLFSTAFSAQATLTTVQFYPSTTNVVFDSGLNAVWTTDGNFLGNCMGQATCDSNAYQSIVTSIIDDVQIVGNHTLVNTDFQSNSFLGLVNWYGAQAYISYLNDTKYAGISNWQLPTQSAFRDTDIHNPNPYNSQLGELYYNQLGGQVGGPNIGENIPFNSAFTHEYAYAYWETVNNNPAGFFMTSGAVIPNRTTNSRAFVWAIASVPEPSVNLLLGIGLMGLLTTKGKLFVKN